ncbi:methyltransferase N6AMT1 isoform X1 [Myotis daubentonii]|uniref:methyltransferase N6AMT1 isoform X1 n=1 Tax=Myotis daubentonii TaxID=98922 RepID=UPI002873A7EA|nr:methyltransferase N6AMT1 isoform X1 [Myotis daubentonii]
MRQTSMFQELLPRTARYRPRHRPRRPTPRALRLRGRSEEMAARGLPTPAHGHAGRGAFRDVYAPAEDTFLLLDALEAAAAELTRCEWAGPRGPATGVPPAAARGPGRAGGAVRRAGDPEAVTALPGSRSEGRGPDVGTGAASAPRGLSGRPFRTGPAKPASPAAQPRDREAGPAPPTYPEAPRPRGPNRKVELCLEVGSGSGVVSTFLASMIGPQALYMCTDINPEAAACTLETARCNRVHVHPVITDLVKGLLPRLKEKVDLLVFNPPYVVTPPEEVGGHGIAAAWAGGRNGREVMDRLFPLVPDLLSPRGLFYLVTIKENDPEDILETMKVRGLQGTTALSRRAGQELLTVLRFTKSPHRVCSTLD